jgi:CDP-paratose 2-epimerase
VKVIVTGSCGLIGSEAVEFYDKRSELVVGIDNNMRASFFGPEGDTTWRRRQLEARCSTYLHYPLDIRDRSAVSALIAAVRPDLIIHCAAQPSHDLAARMPHTDFDINALGTLNLLEAARSACRDTVFVFMSTNKVYGDAPNRIALREMTTRWDYADPAYANGIPESFTIDQSTHSLFGASKLAADLMVQEYGRYFGMATAVFRGGCLTGPGHSGARLHGFLSYLFKAAAAGTPYTVFGYGGKQVRDQIHSEDVIGAFDAFYHAPQSGAVYNLGGGRENSVSVLESIDRVEQLLHTRMSWEYREEPRTGDHICYYSDLTKLRADYPRWELRHSVDAIFEEFAQAAAPAKLCSRAHAVNGAGR